ncbi:uncharacterized protein LOC126176522 [Schistocerca cancellata]|uniref:uncharacterized protein LOC126176522 n=1 Tax=Schistocerca cancellata TaxID=274614 RepID=UPI002117C7DB|nr:uncharacterized protein LOC126176522 [Schistocerca cancellata]
MLAMNCWLMFEEVILIRCYCDLRSFAHHLMYSSPVTLYTIEYMLSGYLTNIIRTMTMHCVNCLFTGNHLIHSRNVAGKIAEGVTFQRILDDVRDSIHCEEVERLHLLTRKDLHNIKREFLIDPHQYHSSDEISVSIFLERMKDCVLMHKQAGQNMGNLSSEDTMIVLMTPFQSELLRKFGSNIVCVDSTHCTNVYKLLVTTLLVIDEFGSGIPVAFCISNKENTAIMTQFFTCVREKAGVIKSTVFMSDDTNVFRCAWAGVMGLAEHNLLCTWHIDRSWRSNLRKVHGGPNKQTQVYKALRMLLEEADIEKFSELLELFERELQEDEDTREFGMYFTNHYGFRPQHWAYCYRRDLNINTNMHLEAMHRVLKYCYLDGKTNNRLDKLLLVLMKLGGHTHRIEKIQERHRESKKIDRGQITANSDGKRFYVKSQSTSGITYTVTLKALECNLSCRLLCCTCNICIHSFSCCCPDNLINLNICKHIHAVSMTYDLHFSKTVKEKETTSIEQASAILSSMKKQNDEATASRGTQLKAKLKVLLNHVDSLDTETEETVEKTVDHLLSLVNSRSKKEGPHCASNEKVQVQRTSNKQNFNPKSLFGKPTLAEKLNVASALVQPDSEVLSVHAYWGNSPCKTMSNASYSVPQGDVEIRVFLIKKMSLFVKCEYSPKSSSTNVFHLTTE